MKYSHIPFSLTKNGKTFYTNMKYAYKIANKLNKQVLRQKITVTYTNWDMRIDVYTGKKTIQKDLDGNPKKISSRPVEVYGYYLVDRIKKEYNEYKTLFFIKELTDKSDKLDAIEKSVMGFHNRRNKIVFINLLGINTLPLLDEQTKINMIPQIITHETIHKVLWDIGESSSEWDNIDTWNVPPDPPPPVPLTVPVVDILYNYGTIRLKISGND